MKLQNLMVFLAFAVAAQASEFHVATKGNDANPGSKKSPFRTIQHAADVAQPGDTITVHEGLYRERINPPRGGASDKKRIVYQAAPGEKVVITGAEPVRNWTRVTNDTWQVTLPNSFFGAFNPFTDRVRGDWCQNPGGYHTGAVYLNGDWLTETTKQDEVLKVAGSNALWFASVDAANTTIWAQFPGVNPNGADVEINVRQTVFTPAQTGINYLTVRGFELRAADAPWAPPTAAQIGIISAYWCKGWIIENNRIRYSPSCGVALGKYGDEWDNGEAIQDKPEWLKKEMQGGTGGYVATTERALTNGWNQATVGSHIVRNNEISHCEQTGIVGSLGCAFSTITGNEIHDIHIRDLYRGAEMAGIKFHGAIDVVISGNHIYRCNRGLWLDWMAQGTRVSGNLFHDNDADQDLFMEVDHGPYLVDNNIFLSRWNLWDMSEGGAFVHNLYAGKIVTQPELRRMTPYHLAHSTELAGRTNIVSRDNRFYNNIFIGNSTSGGEGPAGWDVSHLPRGAGYGLWVFDPRFAALQTGGNVYFSGAQPYSSENKPLVLADKNPTVQLEQKDGRWMLEGHLGENLNQASTVLVTTDLLGKSKIPNLPYENRDGSPLKITTDYFGKKRDGKNPFPGPFEKALNGGAVKVWPLRPAN